MTLSEVETKEDFDELLEIYKTSSAKREVIDEAIRKAKLAFPQFDTSNRLPTQQILDEIKSGEADISDINGF